MGDTKIQWTAGDDGTPGKVWNPIRGCTPVSPGCKNCYAAKVAKRFSFPGGPFQGLVRINAAGERTDEWNGEITYVEDHLLDPLRWKKPARIFVNSMSDLFHHNVSDTVIDRIFAVMALCPRHTFQVLTKRPERMREYLLSRSRSINFWDTEARNFGYTITWEGIGGLCQFPLPNVWLGTSVENQKYADKRIPILLQTPAAVRFISAEPLLGEIRLDRIVLKESEGLAPSVSFNALKGWNGGANRPNPVKLDWVIVGGESQSGSRPMHPDWARSLRDQCKSAGVPFFFKQWGDFVPFAWCSTANDGEDIGEKPGKFIAVGDYDQKMRGRQIMKRVGTKKAGDLLDGVQHHEYPEVRV